MQAIACVAIGFRLCQLLEVARLEHLLLMKRGKRLGVPLCLLLSQPEARGLRTYRVSLNIETSLVEGGGHHPGRSVAAERIQDQITGISAARNGSAHHLDGQLCLKSAGQPLAAIGGQPRDDSHIVRHLPAWRCPAVRVDELAGTRPHDLRTSEHELVVIANEVQQVPGAPAEMSARLAPNVSYQTTHARACRPADRRSCQS